MFTVFTEMKSVIKVDLMRCMRTESGSLAVSTASHDTVAS